MLDAFGVRFRVVGRHADRAQQVDHQAVAGAHPLRQRLTGFGEEHAAIGARGGKAGALQPGDAFVGGGVGDAEAAGDVGGARFPPAASRSAINST